jgi:hypothetical protein
MTTSEKGNAFPHDRLKIQGPFVRPEKRQEQQNRQIREEMLEARRRVVFDIGAGSRPLRPRFAFML